jgi:hypothetical protein
MIAKLLQRKTATGGGGGGAFTPSQLTGLQRWYSATDIVTSGSNVTQFNDKSGGSNHATQATGTKQPILKTNQGSGFQTVSFDGVDDIINFASMTLTGDFTIYWIGYMREADGSGGGFFGEADASLNSLNTYLQGTYWYTPLGDIAQGNNNAITNGLFCEIVARRTGTTVTIEVNGVTNSTSGPVNANPVIGQIGRVYNGYAKVDLAEFLVYNQYHDNATKAQVLSWADGIYLDPYFDKVSLLLHMDGTNGSTTFVDSGPNSVAVTSSSVTISSTGAKSGFGQFGDFPGLSNSSLTISATSLFNFGTDNFTIEGWFNIPVGATGNPFGKTLMSNESNVWSAGAFSFYGLASASQFRPSFWINEFSSGSPILIPSTGDYRDGNWHHIAIVRNGSAFAMYIDGSQVASGTHPGNCGSSTRNLMIGDNLANNGGDRNLLAKIDDIRITKGAARYLANFTPPTAPFYGY